MTREEQVRENRLRRIAERQFRQLTKSKLRDPRAAGYGTYALSEAYYGAGGEGLTLDEVESLLTGEGNALAQARHEKLQDLWGKVSGDISLGESTDNGIEIEVPLGELGWLAGKMSDDGVNVSSVSVRFFGHDLGVLTRWLETQDHTDVD